MTLNTNDFISETIPSYQSFCGKKSKFRCKLSAIARVIVTKNNSISCGAGPPPTVQVCVSSQGYRVPGVCTETATCWMRRRRSEEMEI